MGFRGTVLAVPIAIPIKTVSLGQAPAMNAKGLTRSSPLLKPALAGRGSGTAASKAGLPFFMQGQDVAMHPMLVRAHSPRGERGSVGPFPPSEALRTGPSPTWHEPEGGVDLEKVLLPLCDGPKAMQIKDHGSWVFYVQRQSPGGGAVCCLVEMPVAVGDPPSFGLLPSEVSLHPGDCSQSGGVLEDELPKVRVRPSGESSRLDFDDSVMHISAICEYAQVACNAHEGFGEGGDFRALGCLMSSTNSSAESLAVICSESPSASRSARGIDTSSIRGDNVVSSARGRGL